VECLHLKKEGQVLRFFSKIFSPPLPKVIIYRPQKGKRGKFIDIFSTPRCKEGGSCGGRFYIRPLTIERSNNKTKREKKEYFFGQVV